MIFWRCCCKFKRVEMVLKPKSKLQYKLWRSRVKTFVRILFWWSSSLFHSPGKINIYSLIFHDILFLSKCVRVFVVPPGRAFLQTSCWAPTRSGWRWAALRCSSASVTSPETNASPSSSCSCPTAAPSVCQLTRKCTSSFLWLLSDTCLLSDLGAVQENKTKKCWYR